MKEGALQDAKCGKQGPLAQLRHVVAKQTRRSPQNGPDEICHASCDRLLFPGVVWASDPGPISCTVIGALLPVSSHPAARLVASALFLSSMANPTGLGGLLGAYASEDEGSSPSGAEREPRSASPSADLGGAPASKENGVSHAPG